MWINLYGAWACCTNMCIHESDLLISCRISDPTGVIWGVKLYKVILARLFDPQRSSVKLKNISVTGPSNIEAAWTKQGFLQLPWNPYLTPQEGKTVRLVHVETARNGWSCQCVTGCH